MFAPLDFQFQMMRGDAAAPFVVTGSLIDKRVHPLNQVIRGQTAFRVGRPAKLPVDDIADALEDAPHQPLRHDRFAAPFWSLVLLFCHER